MRQLSDFRKPETKRQPTAAGFTPFSHKHSFLVALRHEGEQAQEEGEGGGGVERGTQPKISQPSSRAARSTTIKILLPLEGGQESKLTAVHSSALLQPHPPTPPPPLSRSASY